MMRFLLLATALTLMALEAWGVRGNSEVQVSEAAGDVNLMNEQENFSDEIEFHESFVGFTAWKTTPQAYVPGDTIIYEGVTLNEGGHYQPLTGRFECPVDGVYFAYTTGRVYNLENIHIGIVKNTEFCAHASSLYGRLPWNSVTNSCLMECLAGEYIFIQAYDIFSDNSGYVYGDSSIPFSTFTVILMHPTNIATKHEVFDGSTASMLGSQTYTSGDTIVFDDVLYNNPGSYYPSVGRYLCRENGIYLVMLTVKKEEHEPLNIGVDHDSYTVMSLSDNEAGNEWNPISNSVLLRCDRNQTITVKATAYGTIYGDSRFFSALTVMMMNTFDTRQHTSFIGCSVWKKQTQDYQLSDTIEYEGVSLNEGGHFDRLLNRFVCPVNAVYYITATARKSGTSNLQVNIVHATVTLFRLEDLGSDNPDNTVSNSALTRCFQGEVIQVKAAGAGSMAGYIGEAYSTLNVMLMYQY